MKAATMEPLSEDTRTFKPAEGIRTFKVTFPNRYGFTVAAHLYLPDDFDPDRHYHGVVISGPYGAVKEQVSGLYAQELARRGLVTLAFDQTFNGESSGEPRGMASVDIFTEDYSAAVDFLGNLTFIVNDQLGAFGICGLGGMAITAAVNDTRIKAVGTSGLYNLSRSVRDHSECTPYNRERRELVKDYLAAMRDRAAIEGERAKGPHEICFDNNNEVALESKRPSGTLNTTSNEKMALDFKNYYTVRAPHPRAINSNSAWDATAPISFFNFRLMENIRELSPRPLLLVTSDQGYARHFTDEAYRAAAKPKQRIVVKDAYHTDLYDNLGKIPFDKIADFFKKSLK
ncbi:MAG: alpha/beta hydrolase [Succinivibrionaceae bacterium]|nr:alpha/beta hydrolase [Succinivibrionaceae bacterium]